MSDALTRANREAAEWYARLSSGGAPDLPDRAAFDRWIAADIEHRRAYAKLEATLSGLSVLRDHPDIQSLRTQAASMRHRGGPGRLYWRAATCGGLAAAAALAFFVALQILPVEQITVQTGPGELRHIGLSDGTQVWIGSDSRIDVAYARGRRGVTLARGEAFFDVAENKQRPFVVSAADRVVTARGTAFDVRLFDSDFSVTLLRGSVGVGRPASGDGVETTLQPGQQYRLAAGISVVRDVDAAAQTAWHDGVIQLTDSSLAEAVATFNHNSRTKLLVGDETVSSLRVSGTFRTGSAGDFAHALEVALPVVVVRQSSGDILLRHR